ncbi:hypothetical protein K2X40_03435 [Candidatus Babeliales bacterium]|nr:hypothetical protein [Candidatus Babeliales bacterium]
MKLTRLFAVVALTATLATNNAHCNLITTLSCGVLTFAVFTSAPFEMLKKLWNYEVKNNSADLELDGNKISEMCKELQQHEYALDILPRRAKVLCYLKLEGKTPTEAAQAYEQMLDLETQCSKALLSKTCVYENFNNAASKLQKGLANNPLLPVKDYRTGDLCYPDKYHEGMPSDCAYGLDATKVSFAEFIGQEMGRISKGEKHPEMTAEKSAEFDAWVSDQAAQRTHYADYKLCVEKLSSGTKSPMGIQQENDQKYAAAKEQLDKDYARVLSNKEELDQAYEQLKEEKPEEAEQLRADFTKFRQRIDQGLYEEYQQRAASLEIEYNRRYRFSEQAQQRYKHCKALVCPVFNNQEQTLHEDIALNNHLDKQARAFDNIKQACEPTTEKTA